MKLPRWWWTLVAVVGVSGLSSRWTLARRRIRSTAPAAAAAALSGGVARGCNVVLFAARPSDPRRQKGRRRGSDAAEGLLRTSSKGAGNLFIANVSDSAATSVVAALRCAIEEVAGSGVESLRVPLDRESGRPRGFAFLSLASYGDAERVRRGLEGREVMGRRLSVRHNPTDLIRQRTRKMEAAITLNRRLARATSPEILELLVQEQYFNEVNLATAMHRLGQNNNVNDSKVLRRLLVELERRVRVEPLKWQPRALANVAWGLARLKTQGSVPVYEAIAKTALPALSRFNAQELANTAWAFAAADRSFFSRSRTTGVFLEALASEAANRVDEFTEQGLTNCAWAFATSDRQTTRGLFAAISKEATHRIADSRTQDLRGETARALAEQRKQNVTNPHGEFIARANERRNVLGHLAAKVESALDEMLIDDEQYFDRFEFYEDFHEAMMPVEAGGRRLRPTPLTFEVLARKAGLHGSWDLAELARADPAKFQAALGGAAKVPTNRQGRFFLFKPQEVANLAWAFASAGFASPALFAAIAADVSSRIDDFAAQGYSNLAWAFATNGCTAHETTAMLQAIGRLTPAKIAVFEGQNLANTAWAFATAGVVEPDLFSAIAREVDRRGVASFRPEALAQLHQLQLFLRVEVPELSPLFQAHDRECFLAAFVATKPSPSLTQKEVAAALTRVGWTHEFEHLTKDGISLDMAQPSVKHALEFDGPNHYIETPTTAASSLNGNSLFKRRMLRRLGWRVVHVPYGEWALLRSQTAQNEYLLRRLAELRGNTNQGAGLIDN